MDTSLKLTKAGSKLTRMCVYHFRFYWLGLRCHMCDLCSKFEEDRAKTAVAILYLSNCTGQTIMQSQHSHSLSNSLNNCNTTKTKQRTQEYGRVEQPRNRHRRSSDHVQCRSTEEPNNLYSCLAVAWEGVTVL